ncbi:hypothetical protein [Nocardia noduli]|uniref:hypothetical protein n=1 Tax=Nocardia noduli TaxID=2815722 RepID=UPI001C213678|nr:hypothetical protein [Nocardia noduli]
MSVDPASAMRPLPHPRAVLVDPRRIWVTPECDAPRAGAPTLGEKAASIDLHLDIEWIPATQYGWARFLHGRTPTWYAQISIDLRTVNNLAAVTLYQWVPWDAIRPAAAES